MLKNIKSRKIIGLGLCLFYGTSFLIYLAPVLAGVLVQHASIIVAAYLILFIAGMGVVFLKEWGRKTIVYLNILMCFYFVVLFLQYPDFVEPSYMFMCILAALFFNQPVVRMEFQTGGQFIRKSILIVDDDEGVIKTVKRILLPNGYSALTAKSGEKGLQIAKLQRPDLIILDVILPGIKGREVCSILKEDEQTRDIPVLFLTAKDSPDDIKAEMAAGGISHLTKPVNARLLLAEIKKILG